MTHPPKDDADLIERLRECPDISNARIVAPADRVPEVVVPTALRDRAAATIARLQSERDAALRQLNTWA